MVAAILQSLGLLAFAAVTYDVSLRHCPSAACRTAALSGVFSLAILLSLYNPVMLLDGLRFDLRHVFLVLAPAYGGLPATIATAVAAASGRIALGGPGVEAGVVGIVLSATSGYLFAQVAPSYALSPQRLCLLGAVASVSLLSLFLVPYDLAIATLAQVAPMLIAAHLVAVPLAGYLMERQRRRARTEQILSRDAGTDELTLLPNRRALDRSGAAIISKAERAHAAVSFLMIDIDRFKLVNDTFGHQAGDEILRTVARIIMDATRREDFAARYGGEEIAVILPYTGAETAWATAERVRASIENHTFHIKGLNIRVTVSIGIHTAATEELTTLTEALALADEALYRAKHQGRNRCEVARAA